MLKLRFRYEKIEGPKRLFAKERSGKELGDHGFAVKDSW